MPGRSTLTATSRPSLQHREVHLRDRRAGHRLGVEAGEDRVDRPAERALDERARLRRRETAARGPAAWPARRRRRRGSRSRRVDSTWPNLTKIGPSRSSAEAQPLAARRVERAADRDHAHQHAHPALAKARQRQLVEAVAQNRDADDDEPGEVPHRAAARRVGRRARARPGRAAPSRPRASAPASQPPSLADLARRRLADDAREVVLRRPSAGCRSASRRRSRTRRRPRPSIAGRSPATSRVTSQRRVGRVDGDAQVGRRRRRAVAPFEQPGRRDAKGERADRGQQRRPAGELDLHRPRRRAARSRSTATGSAAITWLTSSTRRSITERSASALIASSMREIVGTHRRDRGGAAPRPARAGDGRESTLPLRPRP